VAVAAGLAALDLIAEQPPYPSLRRSAETLAAGLGETMNGAGVPVSIPRVESLFSVFFAEGPVRSFADAGDADHERFARFFHGMLERGGPAARRRGSRRGSSPRRTRSGTWTRSWTRRRERSGPSVSPGGVTG
jgi:glutamate-1-semialdehyde aminotransferase